jgi:phosphate transport system substrate-binding protein
MSIGFFVGEEKELTMNRYRCAAISLLCAVIVVPGLFSTAYGQSGKSIRIKGSNIMASMCDEWGKRFAERNPGITVVVQGGGTAAGFEALFDKTAEVVMATQQLSEKEQQAAALAESKPAKLDLGISPIAIVANPGNLLSDLTLEQLRKIFTGDYSRWSELGGPDEQILVMVSPPESGTSIFLRETLLEHGYFSSDAKTKNYFHDTMKEISYKKSAIGYAGLADARKGVKNGWVKILGVKKDAQSQAVFPSAETKKDGSYPILQPLYLYWDDQRVPEHVKKFLEFCKNFRE